MKTNKKSKHGTTQNHPITYRQGDVLFLEIEALPDEDRLTERKGDIIVEGEVTGHAHRLVQGRILEGTQGVLFVSVCLATRLAHVVHEEHHTIMLPPGYYKVIRQREYSPEAIKAVVD